MPSPFTVRLFVISVSGFSVVSPQMRIIEAKSVMIKTEEQQDHHQQQSQHEHPFTTMEIENRLKSLGSPRYFEETPGEEYLAEPSDSLAGDKDHNSPARPVQQTTSLTTMSTSMITSSMRASFASPNNNMNFRHGVTATASPSHRFQQNGHKSPPPSMNKSVTQEPELSGSRIGCTAVMSFRNSKRQLSAFQMTMAELHQAVEPLSFHTSEPLHDMASRLLTSSLRFGRRLPCFRRLPFRDQVILLEEAWREMLLLDSVFWGSSLSPGASSEAESSREQELKTVHETLGPLKTLKLESPEYACLKAIILFRTSKGTLVNNSARATFENIPHCVRYSIL